VLKNYQYSNIAPAFAVIATFFAALANWIFIVVFTEAFITPFKIAMFEFSVEF
jgi:hypothetical protein